MEPDSIRFDMLFYSRGFGTLRPEKAGFQSQASASAACRKKEFDMFARILGAAVVAVMLASPALASQCPTDISKIDAALEANTSLSAEEKAKVAALRDEGEAQHKAGKHDDSVSTLAQAKTMLGIE